MILLYQIAGLIKIIICVTDLAFKMLVSTWKDEIFVFVTVAVTQLLCYVTQTLFCK